MPVSVETFFPRTTGLLIVISLLTAMCLHSPIHGCSTEKYSPYIDKKPMSIAFELVPYPNRGDGQDTIAVNICIFFILRVRLTIHEREGAII